MSPDDSRSEFFPFSVEDDCLKGYLRSLDFLILLYHDKRMEEHFGKKEEPSGLSEEKPNQLLV